MYILQLYFQRVQNFLRCIYAIIYYGISSATTYLSNNVYTDFFVVSAVNFPAVAFSIYGCNRYDFQFCMKCVRSCDCLHSFDHGSVCESYLLCCKNDFKNVHLNNSRFVFFFFLNHIIFIYSFYILSFPRRNKNKISHSTSV